MSSPAVAFGNAVALAIICGSVASCGGGGDTSGCGEVPLNDMAVGDSRTVVVRYVTPTQLEFALSGAEWTSRSSIPSGSGELSGEATLINDWQTDLEGSMDVDLGDVGVVRFTGGPPVCL